MEILYKLVMALIEKSRKETVDMSVVSVLTVQEYELLFEMIKTAKFEGKDVELVYNLILKLQNQYLNLKK